MWSEYLKKLLTKQEDPEAKENVNEEDNIMEDNRERPTKE